MAEKKRYTHDSWWFKLLNRMLKFMNRLGYTPAEHIYILSIPGRKGGKMLSTPISVVTINEDRYVMAVDEG